MLCSVRGSTTGGRAACQYPYVDLQPAMDSTRAGLGGVHAQLLHRDPSDAHGSAELEHFQHRPMRHGAFYRARVMPRSFMLAVWTSMVRVSASLKLSGDEHLRHGCVRTKKLLARHTWQKMQRDEQTDNVTKRSRGEPWRKTGEVCAAYAPGEGAFAELRRGLERLFLHIRLAVERRVLDTAELRNCPHRRLAVERHVCVCVRACVRTCVRVSVDIWLKPFGACVEAKTAVYQSNGFNDGG